MKFFLAIISITHKLEKKEETNEQKTKEDVILRIIRRIITGREVKFSLAIISSPDLCLAFSALIRPST